MLQVNLPDSFWFCLTGHAQVTLSTILSLLIKIHGGCWVGSVSCEVFVMLTGPNKERYVWSLVIGRLQLVGWER